MVRNGLRYLVPELLRMIVLLGMAELVHHDVVLQRFREIDDAVVEGEVSFCGAASPPGLLVPDGDGAVREAVESIEVLESFCNEGLGCLSCFLIGV